MSRIQGVSAELRCPKCDEPVAPRSSEFPLCQHCHEMLTRCVYCRHYRPEHSRCEHPAAADAWDEDPDYAAECAHYDPRFTHRRTLGLWRNIHPALWVGSLVVLIVLLGMLSLQLATQAPLQESGALKLDISLPENVQVGQEFEILIDAVNPATVASPPFRLQLPEQLWEDFTVRALDPVPQEFNDDAGDNRYYDYNQVAAFAVYRVHLKLIPKRPGTFRYRLGVFSQNDNKRFDSDNLILQVEAPVDVDQSRGVR
jgi:hypothetical protein